MAKKTETKKITEDISPVSRQSRVSFAIFMLVFLLCLAVGVAGYFYYQYKHIASPVNDTEEITALTQEIGALMELPGDEVPTLATVTDREKLADQPFFQKAQNGDKVLIYTKSGRAILYRPSIGKIVDVTSVNVANNQPAETSKDPVVPQEVIQQEATPEDIVSAEAEAPRIALYNGTTKKGLTQKYEGDIMKEYSSATIVAKESASKSDYDRTLVIDVTGKQTDLAKKLAATYGVTVTPLPTGESAPADADILIIYGADRL
jgi:hypothetical protein